MEFNFLKELLLNVKPLNNYLNDPITVFDFVEVIIEITGLNARGKRFTVNRRGV